MTFDTWGNLDAAAAQELLRAWPSPALLVDLDGVIVAASEDASVVVGASLTCLVGASLGRLFPAFEAEETWPRWCEELAVVPLDSIHGVRHPGGIRTAEVKARRFGSRVLLLLRDVTDERAMNYQSARRISAATRMTGFFTDVVRHFPLVLYVVDSSGTFRLADGRGLTQFGDVAAHVVGLSIHDVYADRPHILSNFVRALAGDDVNFRTEVGERTFENFVVPMPLEDGTTGLVGVALEVSDIVQKQRAADAVRSSLEQELRDTNADLALALKLRDEFLAATSHELRTPLHTILGLVEAVLEGAFGAVAPSVERPLRATLDAARQQLGHINAILDLTKLEGGTAELRCERTEGSGVAVDAVELSKKKAKRAHVELALVETSDAMVDVDRKRLTRALLELIDNAIAYTPPQGNVRVSVTVEGESLVFAVEDNGVGIDERDRARILQPFVQADGGLARARNGLGLGLALVDRIVSLLGGTLAFTSTVGKGSRFFIRLPLAVSTIALEGHSARGSRATPTAFTNLRIVFVGPRRSFEAHRDLLEIKGAEADVLNVDGALERFEAAPIDVLVVSEHVSPDELARVVLAVRAQSYGSRVAVIVLGTRRDDEDGERLRGAGVEEWLHPDTDVRVFLQIVTREHRRRATLSAS